MNKLFLFKFRIPIAFKSFFFISSKNLALLSSFFITCIRIVISVHRKRRCPILCPGHSSCVHGECTCNPGYIMSRNNCIRKFKKSFDEFSWNLKLKSLALLNNCALFLFTMKCTATTKLIIVSFFMVVTVDSS